MASRAVAEPAPRAVEPGKAGRAPAVGASSSGVVNIASGNFDPSQAIIDEIAASGSKGLDVRVIAKGLTEEGRIKLRQDSRKKIDSIGKGSMPILNPWTQKLGGLHLNFAVSDSAIKDGQASFKPRGGDKNDWLQALQKNATLLGGLGLKVERLPVPVNKFEGGKLVLGATGIKILVGGYVDANFDLLVENMSAPKVNGSAKIDIKGAATGELTFDNSGEQLKGSVSLAVQYKSFSGAVKVTYLADGTVDVAGKAAYSADKLSGEIAFVATDLDAANKFARDAISAAGGKENVQNAAAPAPVPAAKEGQKKRALAATGQLGFNLTKWFAGTVNVVVDGKGAITVIGKIAPPGEIVLFKQRDWDKQIVKFEAKAYYGIPVVGNLNLFANISLHAIAKLGPAKLYAIEILGTYSTDPEIQKNIQISGSLNISAYAGLRLHAEGGAGIEILSHDLKFGIGLNADVGVKAYADARPTIGYRDPGEFYISGTLDLVAQPMLGLGGEFFIELDAPWFSPLSDDRWSWPLFSKEWPLSDPIGISATVKDYVLGSGNVPEITMKPPEFDPSKFMTNMVDDKLPNKSGGAGSGHGTFKEDGSVPKPVVPPKKPAPKAAPAKPGKKGAKPGSSKSASPDPKGAKEKDNTKLLKSAAEKVAALKSKPPIARAALDQELAKIKAQVGAVTFDVKLNGTKWSVTPKMGGKAAKTAIEIGADPEFQWWKEKLGFTNEDREGHTLQFIGTGLTATFGIATSLMSIRAYLDSHSNKTSSDAKDRSDWATANKVFEDQSKVVFGFAKKSTAEVDKRKGITAALAKISAAFVALSGDPPKDVDYEKNSDPTYGNPAAIKYVHTKPNAGSEARPWPQTGIWKKIQENDLTTIVDSWVQMHIIADNLGGSGKLDSNLIPAPNSVNRGAFYSWENKTIALIGARSRGVKNMVWVSVSVGGTKTAPTSITGQAGLYLWKGKNNGNWMKMPSAMLSVSVGVPKPNLTGTRKFSLNFTSPKVMIKEFGISAQMAGMIYRERDIPYKSLEDWASRMIAAGATSGQITAVLSRGPLINE